MPILEKEHIANEEVAMIQRYLSCPQLYIDEQYYHYFEECLPDGLKLSAFQTIGDSRFCTRFFIFPGAPTVRIGLKNLIVGDKGEHSCTVIGYKMYFHQNADDLAQRVAVYEVDGEFSHYGTEQNYLKRPEHHLDSTVKWLITKEGVPFVLRSTPIITPCAVISHCLLSLYLASFVRNDKRIDLMYYQGENLTQYLSNRVLNPTEKDQIAGALIAALNTLHEGIVVHTDIKTDNICVRTINGEYRVTFIDDTEAYRGENTLRGRGTPGYLAPELFIDAPSFLNTNIETIYDFIQWQQEITDSRQIFNHFIEDRERYFTQNSDRFALGLILLVDLELKAESVYFNQAVQWCSEAPQKRALHPIPLYSI